MVLFVLLAVAFVMLLPQIKVWFPSSNNATNVAAPTGISFQIDDPAEINTIHISHIEGDAYTLYYFDGLLCLPEGDHYTVINDAFQEDILSAVTEIVVQDVISEDHTELTEHLADMGLSPAQATATVRYNDQTEVIIEVGYAVPGTAYYYYRWSGNPGIFICDLGIVEALSLTANRLLPITQPVIEQSLIDELTIDLQVKESIGITFSADNEGYISGLMHTPFTYPLNAESTENLLTTLENFRLGTAQGTITDENLSEYGFDDPLCVFTLHQNAGSRSVVNSDGQLAAELLDEVTYRFTIGREEGSYFYTCEYEGECYYISRFLTVAVIQADPALLMTRTPANLGDAEISAIAIQTGAGAVDIRITRTEQVLQNNELATDDNGNILYDTLITLNGESIPEAKYNQLLEGLQGLTASDDLDPSWLQTTASPRWRMTITTTGGTTRTILAYPLDAFSNALVVDGVAKHYIHVEALEIAIGEFLPDVAQQE